MNWFAIGAGAGMIVLCIDTIARRPGQGRLPRPAAITLGLVGLFFLYLGAAPGLES